MTRKTRHWMNETQYVLSDSGSLDVTLIDLLTRNVPVILDNVNDYDSTSNDLVPMLEMTLHTRLKVRLMKKYLLPPPRALYLNVYILE
jgi:hypothetical protein